MIILENIVLPSPEQWEAIIRGMRNPMNSWDRSDSEYEFVLYHDRYEYEKNHDIVAEIHYDEEGMDVFSLGTNDLTLMENLAAGGPVHAKYRRMTIVFVDITAPLYWWKEFDTYKVGTVANSCSTMHKIQAKEFTLEDFSCERMSPRALKVLESTILELNYAREKFLETKDKQYWEDMIQLLPSSYNQKRTVLMNYEVLAGIYPMRKNHKLKEWHDFCDWIKTLPESHLITRECDKEIIYELEFFGHHIEAYVPANATETERNAAIFEALRYELQLDVKNAGRYHL